MISKPDDRESFCRVAIDYMVLTQRMLLASIFPVAAAEGVDTGGEEMGRKAMTVLVLKDFSGEAILTYPVKSKGLLNDQWVVPQILEDLEALGLNGPQLAVKCDQEPAIIEVQQELKRKRDESGRQRTLLEHSRLGDSDSNGRIERAVGEAAAMMRTLRSSLEETFYNQCQLSILWFHG